MSFAVLHFDGVHGFLDLSLSQKKEQELGFIKKNTENEKREYTQITVVVFKIVNLEQSKAVLMKTFLDQVGLYDYLD